MRHRSSYEISFKQLVQFTCSVKLNAVIVSICVLAALQVSTLESERARAAQEAQAAQQRAAELQEGKRRFEWQSALLQRLMEVQLKHNKTKTQSLRCGDCQFWQLHVCQQPSPAAGYRAMCLRRTQIQLGRAEMRPWRPGE